MLCVDCCRLASVFIVCCLLIAVYCLMFAGCCALVFAAC